MQLRANLGRRREEQGGLGGVGLRLLGGVVVWQGVAMGLRVQSA